MQQKHNQQHSADQPPTTKDTASTCDMLQSLIQKSVKKKLAPIFSTLLDKASQEEGNTSSKLRRMGKKSPNQPTSKQKTTITKPSQAVAAIVNKQPPTQTYPPVVATLEASLPMPPLAKEILDYPNHLPITSKATVLKRKNPKNPSTIGLKVANSTSPTKTKQ